MAREVGRSFPLSPFRRLVTDMMRVSCRVPAVTADRRMNLSVLAAARQRCTPRPGWTVLFTKAMALVARVHPELRRSYMEFPRPRFYEHPSSIVALNVERQVGEEMVVAQCLIRRPDDRSLVDLDAIVRHFQSEPVENLRWYRRALTMSKTPWPIRPFVWWGSLNLLGRIRCHNFGTFSVSSIAGEGAGLLHLIPLLTSGLHYSLFDDAGNLEMRLTWDHRVMDGMAAARILVDLERTLKNEILAELNYMRLRGAA
jgi:hypothetical protein